MSRLMAHLICNRHPKGFSIKLGVLESNPLPEAQLAPGNLNACVDFQWCDDVLDTMGRL